MKDTTTRRESLKQIVLAGVALAGASMRRRLASAAEPQRAKIARPGRKIRFGVSGLGGRGLNWIGMLTHSEDVEVVAACDITPASVVAARHFFPSLICYDSLPKMLEHEIDAVLVATPAFKHATDAIAALNAGKHVLSEVTACWTMAEAVALYEAAKKSKAVYSFGERSP